jgi:ribonuclease HII
MPDLSYEQACGPGVVCGIDEVGRGPLAGPVVAAAVILPKKIHPRLLAELDDSKKLSAKKRDALCALILAEAQIGLGRAEVEEIDRINILQATFLAMTRAVTALGGVAVDYALVDGNQTPPLPVGQVRCLVKGDSKSLSIAAASVIAKVARDREMSELSQVFPGYDWEHNAGYGTARHLAAIRVLGITPHHRKSFAPIRERIVNP